MALQDAREVRQFVFVAADRGFVAVHPEHRQVQARNLAPERIVCRIARQHCIAVAEQAAIGEIQPGHAKTLHLIDQPGDLIVAECPGLLQLCQADEPARVPPHRIGKILG